MAKYQFKGLEEYAQYLQRIEANTQEICGEAVYAMADIVTDKIRENLEALPSVSTKEALEAWKTGQKTQLTKAQKKSLEKSLGISSMQNDNGYWNVKVGFDGYNTTKTKSYPQGQPNALIARATESGSSFRDKTPFIRPAVKETEGPAVQKAKDVVEQKIKQLEK